MNRTCRIVLVLVAVALFATTASGQQVIQLRTGQVGGAPGSCPGLDDTFRYNPTSMAPCGQPFRAAPFTAADFAGAVAGPPARVISGPGVWLPSLTSDPLARWIDWQEMTPSCWGDPRSVLYAARFDVTDYCATTGTVAVCWAADDALGDPAGPNPIGIYINGVALNAGFSGGNYATETCFSQANVPLNPGANYFYVYQRDAGCSVAGVILSARITVDPSPDCPSITVYKFHDLNGNGIDDGEPPLPGWTFNISGPTNLSGTTGANGMYTFFCVPPGIYTITEVTQPGWVATTPGGAVQTLTVTCGQAFIASFGNRVCQQGQSQCIPLPKCLTSWYPFEECAGIIANEVVGNRDGQIVGGNLSPTWGAGRWGTTCGINVPGTPGTSAVLVPDYPEHDFGIGSFTLFAWVKTTNSDGFPHTILDKRDVPFSTPTGYSLYYRSGRLEFQYNDGIGAPTTHVSTGPLLSDGIWHTVAVSVCRYPSNPSANVTYLVVDNYADTFTGASIPTGSLSNNAGLTMGEQCPGFILGIPFAGAIDDVLVFKKCCLTPNQIFALRTDFPYCHEKCYVPSIVSTSGSTVTTTLTLCNYSLTAQTYTWTIAGLPAGPGCSVAGPTVFSPASGSVTIPAATSGPSCVNIPIVITLPSGMLPGQTACYQVTTQNLANGECCIARGRVRKNWWLDPNWNPALVGIPIGNSTPLTLQLYNSGESFFDITYRIAELDEDGDDTNPIVSLNGLPPGEPWIDYLSIAPGQTGEVVIDAMMGDFQPFNIREIVLSADLDGDGSPEDLAVSSLMSSPEQGVADAPEVPLPAATPASTRPMLSVSPNPFRDATAIRLALAQAESAVRLEVYDVGGRLVRTIHSGALAAGIHTMSWDGRDGAGRTSPAGLYFLRAWAAEVELQRKLIRIE